ncbi:MAG: glycosyltransferase family 4 protein [Patescibacteria group bacterium]
MKKQKLRIAILDSVRNPVPSKGVIQASSRIALRIADGMAMRGHDITLFGAKGSRSKANVRTGGIRPASRTPLFRLIKHEPPGAQARERERAINLYEGLGLAELYREHSRRPFDVVHLHRAHHALPQAALFPSLPHLFTFHDEATPLRRFAYKHYAMPNIHFVALSKRQRQLGKDIPWAGIVPNGIDVNRYRFSDRPERRLVFAGRLVEEKGAHLAIAAAKRVRWPLRIIGPRTFQTLTDTGYWERQVEPLLDSRIRYAGFLPPAKLAEEYSRAAAVLMPIDWEEPFGLVSVEAMACGTPVIGFRRGALPEIIKDGTTGFLVDDVAGMVQAIRRVQEIDRTACRRHVERHFTADMMVGRYEDLYFDLARARRKRRS